MPGYLGEVITLPRYAQMIAYDECRFFGVQKNTIPRACKEFWTERERADTERYLAMAQDMIEGELTYPLAPKWIAGEERPYAMPLMTLQKHVIEAGVMGTTTVQVGAAVVHTNDPAVVGPIATALTNTAEIKVFYAGTDIEIIPTSIVISGGNLTIEIPRCRTVDLDLQGDTPVEYDTLSNFVTTVDVKRIYNDTSTQATLIWPHTCTAACTSNGCGQDTQTACMYVMDSDIAKWAVKPASYANGTWIGQAFRNCGGRPYKATLNYRAGLQTLPSALEDAVLRLAHSLMPTEPCGCQVISRMWQRDRNVPQQLTRERINCPFGLSDGAWMAYRMVSAKRVLTASTL